MNAGFRESGLQSLSVQSPMVAIRTAGLALDSLIGYQVDNASTIHPLVSEEYLRLLTIIANERFIANKERIGRLQQELKAIVEREEKETRMDGSWEDSETRRVRMREEGLRRKETERMRSQTQETTPRGVTEAGDVETYGVSSGMLFSEQDH